MTRWWNEVGGINYHNRELFNIGPRVELIKKSLQNVGFFLNVDKNSRITDTIGHSLT